MEFNGEQCRLIIIKDISELSRSEYTKSVEHLTQVMIASTSHDMRTPLNTIINMHKLMGAKATDPLVLKWIKVADNSTNLLLHLVNDTLDYF